MLILKTHYKDARPDADIAISNTEADYHANSLSFTLDGITFHDASLGDLQLTGEAQ